MRRRGRVFREVAHRRGGRRGGAPVGWCGGGRSGGSAAHAVVCAEGAGGGFLRGRWGEVWGGSRVGLRARGLGALGGGGGGGVGFGLGVFGGGLGGGGARVHVGEGGFEDFGCHFLRRSGVAG